MKSDNVNKSIAVWKIRYSSTYYHLWGHEVTIFNPPRVLEVLDEMINILDETVLSAS